VTSTGKAASNRRNAARSTGPRTPDGKRKAALNATRHGLRALSPVVPGLERRADWDQHQASILDALEPLGALEEALADRVALLLWRLGRVVRYEREAILQGQESGRALVLELGGAFDPARLHPDDVESFAEDAHLDGELLDQLPALPADEMVEANRVASILYRVERTLDLDLDELSLPGVPEDAAIEDVTWTAGALLAAIAAMAAAGSEADGIRVARSTAFSDALRLGREARKNKADRLRIRRERILPDSDTLEKLSRYEAHLDRVMVRTLHELHRLQAARGRSFVPTPLALDVDLILDARRPPAEPLVDGEEA